MNFGSALHHGYLLEGSFEDVRLRIETALAKHHEIHRTGNPDYQERPYEHFGIDDARALKESASRKPFSNDGRKVYVLGFQSITTEAQNALLKLFEEPVPRTHFFVIVPSRGRLLETLRSRLSEIKVALSGTGEQTISAARSFLNEGPARRLALVAPLIESKDKSEAQALLGGIEVLLHERFQKDILNREITLGLREICAFRPYLLDRSSSLKLILEHLALTVPRLS